MGLCTQLGAMSCWCELAFGNIMIYMQLVRVTKHGGIWWLEHRTTAMSRADVLILARGQRLLPLLLQSLDL